MSQSKTIMLAQGSTGPGPAHSLQLDLPNRGYVFSVGGVNAPVTASVAVEVSTDGVTWAQGTPFSLSGTSTTTVPVVYRDVDPNSPFPLVRANVLNVTGGGFVTVSVTASVASAGATDFRRTSDGAQSWVGVGDDHTLPVSLSTGADTAANAVRVMRGANTPLVVLPAFDAQGPKPNIDVILGTIGQVGDVIDSLIINVLDNTACAVFLRDGDVPDLVTGTSGTSPAGSTVLTLTSTASSAAVTNQYFGRVLSLTYIPTSGAATKIKRRIVAHAAPSGTAWSSITVDQAVPAGATVTQWAIEHQSSVQLCGAAMPDSRPIVLPGGRSQNGRYRLTVDKGAQVTALGSFT